MQAYSRYVDAEIALARLPYSPTQSDPPAPGDPIAIRLIGHQLFTPDFLSVRADDFANSAQNNLLVASFALRAYALEHGRYPATLKELVPSYLNAVPTDPFSTGKALRYTLSGKRYLLYSIGPDGKDDGGNPSTDRTISQTSRGDIVAGVNVK
jgi:hypothetical protein